MLSYILKVTLCWAACFLFYHFLLRKETFFNLNRWYLLGTAFLGLVIPAIDLQFFVEQNAVAPMAYYLQPVTIGVEQLETVIVSASTKSESFDWWGMLTMIYFIGMSAAFIRFGYGLWQIYRLFRNGETEKNHGYRFVSTSSEHVPFSFFNHLFWSEKFLVENTDRESIIRHEEAHIFQKHSFDVLFMELLAVVFWCSPPIYLFQKAVKTNHEYLADEAVLLKASRKNYGRLLLRQFQPGVQLALSNSLFSSQLKNRIVMMTKTKSTRLDTLKYLAGVPLLALLFLAFSFTEGSQSMKTSSNENSNLILRDTSPDGEVFKEVEEMPRFPGCEDIADADEQKACWQKEMLMFIYKNMKYPEEARKNGVNGMVVVKFVVGKDGSIADAEIMRSIGGGGDEEVLKVVYRMPKWVPGKIDGKPVRVEFNLPVKFKLDPEGEKQKADVDDLPLFLSGCENVSKEELNACSKKQLISFIVKNLKYPEATKKAAIEGMVVASFIVAEDGSVTNPKIVKSLDEHTDAEVLRILNEMPTWKPGTKDGKAVATEMKLPFKFALSKEEGRPSWRGEAKNLAKKVELFQVYPNPATGNISVNFKTDAGPVIVRLTDVEGRGLASMDLEHSGDEQLAAFSTSDMPRGNVYVSLIGKGGEVLETTMIILQ